MSKEMLHLLCMVWAKEAVIAQNNSGYTMTLKNCDQKVLSSTSRPRQLQEFLDIGLVCTSDPFCDNFVPTSIL